MKLAMLLLCGTLYGQEKPRVIAVKPFSVSLFATDKFTFGKDQVTSNVGVAAAYRINSKVQIGGYYAHDPIGGTNGVTGIVSVKVFEYGRKR